VLPLTPFSILESALPRLSLALTCLQKKDEFLSGRLNKEQLVQSIKRHLNGLQSKHLTDNFCSCSFTNARGSTQQHSLFSSTISQLLSLTLLAGVKELCVPTFQPIMKLFELYIPEFVLNYYCINTSNRHNYKHNNSPLIDCQLCHLEPLAYTFLSIA
jgi:hypothetical protein